MDVDVIVEDQGNPNWDGRCHTNFTFDDAQKHMYTRANLMFVVVGVPTVLTIGVLGNAGFLVVLYRVKHMRSITNFYLANLSIADLCLLVMSALQYFWTYSHSPLDVNFVFASTFGCAVPNFLVYLCYFASVWLVTLVATERYMAICYPLQHHIITGTRRSFRLVSIAWGVAFAMTCFAAPYGNPEIVCIDWPDEGAYANMPVRVPVCRGTCDWCDKTLYAIDPIQFVFAFLINSCMYGRIVMILSKRSALIDDENKNSSSLAAVTSARVQADNRDQVARMLIINTVVFFVCLMPYCITNLNSFVKEVNNTGFLTIEESNILSWISKLTTLLNSAGNPYLYSATNKRYRKAFMQAFRCRGGGKDKGGRRASSFAYTKGSIIDTRGSTIGESRM